MESQPSSLPAQADTPHTGASTTPRQSPRRALRWTLLRMTCTHRRDEYADGGCAAASQMVGIRDRESGQTRIFTIYRQPSGMTNGVEPPPDPDPPPAAPARARPHAGLSASDDEPSSDALPHARAA